LQFNEMTIGGDIVALLTPSSAGSSLCYFMKLVAAGGLAAALSTAWMDCCFVIANALGHDLYYKMIDLNASGLSAALLCQK
jgi:cation/acetate symporter